MSRFYFVKPNGYFLSSTNNFPGQLLHAKSDSSHDQSENRLFVSIISCFNFQNINAHYSYLSGKFFNLSKMVFYFTSAGE